MTAAWTGVLEVETWLESESVLKVEPIRCPSGLDMKWEQKHEVNNNSEVFWSE